MHVKVKVYSVLKEVFGVGEVSIKIQEKKTLDDLLTDLKNHYGEDFRKKTDRDLDQALKNRFNIFLNGKKVELPKDLSLQLKDKDELTIIQPVGGG